MLFLSKTYFYIRFLCFSFIRLHVNLSSNESADGNDTIEVSLDPVPEREAVSCNLAVLPVVSMARWKVGATENITLKDELLLAGVHIFSGKHFVFI